MEEKEITIDVTRLLSAYLKKVWIVIISVLLCSAIAFVYSTFFVPQKYTYGTRLFVVNSVDYASTVSVNELNGARSLAEVYSVFLVDNNTLSNVSKAINGVYSTGQLKSMVSVSRHEDTEILQIYVTCQNPENAKKVADLVAQKGIEEINRLYSTAKVNVVDHDNAASPVSNGAKRNISIAAVIAFAISSAIILLINMLDKRVKSAEQLTDRFGYDVLGIIPAFNGGDLDE